MTERLFAARLTLRRERLGLVRDGRAWLAGGALALLLIAALVTGAQYYRDVSIQQSAARAAERERWLTQQDRDAHSTSHFGITAYKVASPLSMLDNGVDPYVGVAVPLEAHRRQHAQFAPVDDMTMLQRMGELTVAGTLQLLLPLLIILLGFTAFSGEREAGTLRMLVSVGVSKGELAAGKAGAVATVLGGVLIPLAMLAALALSAFVTDGGEMTSASMRLATASVVYAVYCMIFVALTIAVSLMARSSSAALLALLTVWLLNALIAPRVAAEIARFEAPVPSAVHFAASEPVDEQTSVGARARAEFTEQVLKRYNVEAVEQLPFNIDGLWLEEAERRSYRRIDARQARLDAQYDAQDRVYVIASVFAPLLAVQSLSMALAGTDFAQQRRFLAASEQYRRDFLAALNADFAAHRPTEGERHRMTRETRERIPAFSLATPAVAEVLRWHWREVVILVAWALGSIALLAGVMRASRGVDA